MDCDPDTLNIDPTILKAITNKTKAIVPVHYAGVSCDMAVIMQIADEHGLAVIEDAAQAFGAFYKNQHLGSIDTQTYSFHYTKTYLAVKVALFRSTILHLSRLLK